MDGRIAIKKLFYSFINNLKKSNFKRIIFFIVIVLFSFLLSAQNKLIDSLKNALNKEQSDTVRCRILNDLIELEEDDRIWSIYNDKLKNIAERNLKSEFSNPKLQLFYYRNLAISLNNFGFILNSKGDRMMALKYYDRALSILKHIKDSSRQALTLTNIASVYDDIGESKLALTFNEKGLQLQTEIGDLEGISTTLNNMGIIYKNLGMIKEALAAYHKSLKIAEQLKNTKDISLSLNNIGAIYNNQGQIKEALLYFSRSLKIEESIGDEKGIALALNNLGNIYFNQGQIKEALDYYGKSLSIEIKLGNQKGIAISYNNIGFVHSVNGTQNKALEFYHKSLKIYELSSDKMGMAQSLHNIATVYKKLGDEHKAFEYLSKSLKLKEEIGDKGGITVSYYNIAELFLNKSEIIQAKKYALKSMSYAKELGYPEDIRNAAAILKAIYKKENNFEASFEMFELEINMRDSINNEATKKASVRKQFQYQYEKKAAADSVKNMEQQKVKNAQLKAQQAQLKQEKTQRLALYGSLLLVIVFSGFVFNRFKLTQKQKLIIELQKENVDKAYATLHEKNKEITDSIIYARRIQKSLLTSEKYFEKHICRLINRK